MKQPLYLVTGATGVTGGYAINSLLSKPTLRSAPLVPREDERSEALKQRGVELFVGRHQRLPTRFKRPLEACNRSLLLLPDF